MMPYQFLHRAGLFETFCFAHINMKGCVFRPYNGSQHLFLTMKNL